MGVNRQTDIFGKLIQLKLYTVASSINNNNNKRPLTPKSMPPSSIITWIITVLSINSLTRKKVGEENILIRRPIIMTNSTILPSIVAEFSVAVTE